MMGSYQAHLDAQLRNRKDVQFQGLIKSSKAPSEELDPRRRRREGPEFQEEMDWLIQSENLMGV